MDNTKWLWYTVIVNGKHIPSLLGKGGRRSDNRMLAGKK